MRVLRESDGLEIALDGPLLGRGGEASVYAVPDCPDLVAKIYHNPTEEHAGKLAAMLAAPPVPPPSRSGHVAIAWPVGRLLDSEGERRIVGALMPRVESAHLLWEIYNPGARRRICPQFHHSSLLRTARNLACVVRTLHERGYVVGDLNESNVLVTPQGLVTLLDVDSIQVPAGEQLYRCRVGRAEYTPPELQGVAFSDVERCAEHDNFALAVLIFQLLMQGVHPFAGVCTNSSEAPSIPARIRAGAWPYAWEREPAVQPSPHAPPWFVLPPAVQDLFSCCFEDAAAAPSLRPSAAIWQQALEEAEQTLASCADNGQHVFARGLDVCPWCALGKQQGRDPFPAPGAARGRRTTLAQAQSARATRLTVAEGTRPITGSLREDPLPPPPAPARATPSAQAGVVEGRLRGVGAAVERNGWLVWLVTALLAIVAGMLWALSNFAKQDGAPPAPQKPSPVPAASAPTASASKELQAKAAREVQRAEIAPAPAELQAKAAREAQRAEARYQKALRSYVQAVGEYRRGERTQEEIVRASHELQDTQRRWREALEALVAARARP